MINRIPNFAFIIIAIILVLSNDFVVGISIQVFPVMVIILLIALIVFATFKKPEQTIVIGIDLGTTYSRVGVYKNDRLQIITNDQGKSIIPSYVAFDADGQCLIGDDAKNHSAVNPKNTIYNVKRLMGREWTDEIQESVKNLPYTVIPINGKPHIKIQTRQVEQIFAPEKITSLIIVKLKEMAEAKLGKRVTHAIVTVPANFNDAQRQATKNAVAISRLTVSKIINAPSAAAITYGLDKKMENKTVIVYNLGGGYFDVSLINIGNNVFKVLSTDGNPYLGGEDFDQRVVDYLIKQCEAGGLRNIREDKNAIQKLRIEVEKAKKVLSSSDQVIIKIESIYDGQDFVKHLTRREFEELNMELFNITLNSIERVLKDAGKKKEDVDDYILVGGGTRIPKIQLLVKQFFGGKEPYPLMNLDEAVISGATRLSDVKFTETVDLFDVNPLSLGIEVDNGTMFKVIPRNTPIPMKIPINCVPVFDNQTSVNIKVYEGENKMAKDNNFLGQFELTGISPFPSDTPKIVVTYELDTNGILRVSAEDTVHGNRKDIVINYHQKRLSPEDIERMIE